MLTLMKLCFIKTSFLNYNFLMKSITCQDNIVFEIILISASTVNLFSLFNAENSSGGKKPVKRRTKKEVTKPLAAQLTGS